MKHEDAFLLLDEYAAHELPEKLAARVEEHIESCAECRSMLEVEHGLRRSKAQIDLCLDPGHPSADALISFSIDDGTLSAASVAEIEDHLKVCNTCCRDARELRRVLIGQKQRSFQRWAVPLAAAAVLVAMVVPVARYIDSRTTHPLKAGPVALLYLPEQTRETGLDLPIIRLIQKQDVIPIIVKWDSSWNTSHLLVAVSRTGHVDPALNFTVDPTCHNAELGILMLSIPAADLPPAEYSLSIRDAGSDKVLANWTFRIATAQ